MNSGRQTIEAVLASTQALIGDGLSGSGYALSNAEFGRISGTNVGIGARVNPKQRLVGARSGARSQ